MRAKSTVNAAKPRSKGLAGLRFRAVVTADGQDHPRPLKRESPNMGHKYHGYIYLQMVL